jgi:hypothetical protein
MPHAVRALANGTEQIAEVFVRHLVPDDKKWIAEEMVWGCRCSVTAEERRTGEGREMEPLGFAGTDGRTAENMPGAGTITVCALTPGWSFTH